MEATMTEHIKGTKYELTKPVFFIGFMGAGKTSVSQQLAVTRGLASIDADEYLELRENRIITDIFAEDGEEGFRDIETDVLRDLAKRSPRLIGCGGGVVSKRPVNAQIMHDAGFVVYLEVTADGAAERIPNTDSRPMFKNLENARKTLETRRPQYEAAADVTVQTEGRSVVDIANEVAQILLDQGIMVEVGN
jgi:shikimate kinase